MEFRPCIDIHNGRVKQIVGGSLSDDGDFAKENFVSEMEARDYAVLYRERGLAGGHIILLNAADSPYYEEDLRQAKKALEAWPDALQIGGGVTAENAARFLDMGAGHVIVTSYVFSGGEIHFGRLEKLRAEVGKERLVLDVSCRILDGRYYIVTDRWQKYTNVKLSCKVLEMIAAYCDEFLVHGVDVEGYASGIDEKLASLLKDYEGIPVTYAGGIGSLEDLERFRLLTEGKLDFTVGSALDLFGGQLPYDKINGLNWDIDSARM